MQRQHKLDDAPYDPIRGVREQEVARLVATGLSNREIAERLCLSHATVHNHLDHIYKKLGLHGRVELALWLTGQHLDLSSPENEPIGP